MASVKGKGKIKGEEGQGRNGRGRKLEQGR